MSNRESFLRWQRLVEGLDSRAIKVLAVIEHLHKEGVIPDYVLVGGLAATFYLESVYTRDVDFVFPISVKLDRLSDLYQRLEELGYGDIDSEGYLLIEGWPVHFLPPFNSLLKKMLETARIERIDGLACKVALPEYLVADSVRMSRPEKDYGRIIRLRELPSFREDFFQAILREFNLEEQWRKILPKLS
jgi:hypothetical protein